MINRFTNWLRSLYLPKSKPAPISCQECLEIMDLVVDNEATQKEWEAFYNHIDDCLKCLERYQLDAELKQTLSRKISKKAVPSDLVETILNKVRETV